ncbi:MAG: hypothetical protein NVS3B24_23630 [Candidatus Dormibacteria bacterium]
MDEFGRTLSAARRGDDDAWSALYSEFFPMVFRYLTARTGDRSLAEELSQDVFIAAVRGLKRLREDSQPGFEGWLIRIAANRHVDWVRRQGRQLPEVAVPGPDPADLAVDRLASAEVMAAVARLTPDQQDVIVQRFVLDRSLADVAHSTRRSLAAVKALQHRALATLDRELTEAGYDRAS